MATWSPEIGDIILHNVHPPSACEGTGCPIHHPSDHPYKEWPTVWVIDKAVRPQLGFVGRLDEETEVVRRDPDDEAFQRGFPNPLPPTGVSFCEQAVRLAHEEKPGLLRQLVSDASPEDRIALAIANLSTGNALNEVLDDERARLGLEETRDGDAHTIDLKPEF